MLFFHHPPPPSRKEVAMQMVQQRAGLVPDLGVIVVESRQIQQGPLRENQARPESA